MKKFLSFIFFTAVLCSSMYAQQTVRGTVTDSQTGDPLIGVNIMIDGTTTGTITDFDGVYELDVPANSSLRYTYTGFEDQVIAVDGQSVIDIDLASGVLLDEVVVTSLGMAREKKALGYSVQEVKGESFQEAREINIGNALAGKIAGVNVSSIASGPAGSSRVIIRGNTSLGGNNQPLYVIDGVPMDNSGFGQAGLWGGADEGDGMSSVNPDDIESMTVLKGANAAALYGSRASNGVILITTKTGANKKGLGIEINSNMVAEQYLFPYEFQETHGNGFNGAKPANGDEAWNSWGSNWGPELDGSQVPIFNGELRPYTFETYNNLEKFYRTGTTFTNSVGFTQAGDDYNIRLNFSDLRSKAITPNQGFDRQNVSLSYRGTFADRVEVTSKVLYSHEFANNRPRIADSPGNAFQAILRLPSNYNIDDMLGDPNKPGAIKEGDPIIGTNKFVGGEMQMSPDLWNANPYWAAYQFDNDDVRDRIINSNVVKFNITDFAYIQGRFSMDWYTRRDTDITPTGTGYQLTGSMQERERRIREINIEGLIGLNHRIGDITLDGFVGGNRMRRQSETLSLTGGNFNIPFFHQVSNLQNQNIGYGFSGEGINSVLGSATVGYGDFLYLTATARNDWFSTLNPETNSILYPSIGGTLIFSELLDLPSNHILTFGKLRASWAQVGGDTDPYRLDLTYGLGNGHVGQPTANIQQNSIPNPLLKPLTSTEIEVGVDLRFLNNRIGVDLTYYDQKTTDDILNASIAESSGFSGTTINIGEITNRGVELLLTGRPLQSSKFNWDIGVNFAYNDSEVVQLAEGLNQIRVDGGLGEPRTRWAFIEHVVGRPFGTITGFVQERINGVPVFNAENGQPVRTSSTEILGNGVAKYTGGITNDFQIGPVHLDMLVDFKAGGKIYSGSNVRFMGGGRHINTVSEWTDDGIVADGRKSVVVTGVDQEGNPYTHSLDPETEIPGFYGAYSQLSDRFIRDGSFAKLRQISAGYSLPRSVIDKTPLQSVRLSIVARNLLTLYDKIENVDAESTYNNSNAQGLDYYGLPTTRTYGFNIKAAF